MNTFRNTPILVRVPPGDNWKFAEGYDFDFPREGSPKGSVYSSLTEALNEVFLASNHTSFLIDAKSGKVYIPIEADRPVDLTPPKKTYSIYGD